FDIIRWHVQREIDASAHFSVYRNRVFKGIGGKVLLVVLRIPRVEYGLTVSQQLPQFFCDMRCKGRQYDRERLKDSALVAFQRRKLIGTDHELTDGRIEREPVDVVGHFADGLVENPQFLRRCRSIAYVELTILVVKQVPEFSKELIYTINSVGTPGFGYFKRSQEHLVHTQGVGT